MGRAGLRMIWRHSKSLNAMVPKRQVAMRGAKLLEDLFPIFDFININHLALSDKNRFNAKQIFFRAMFVIHCLSVQELHLSSARDQHCFFQCFPIHAILYNTQAGCLGQCILICRKLLNKCRIAFMPFDFEHGILDKKRPMDNRNYHHLIFIPGVTHGFWWQVEYCMHLSLSLFVNIYLDSHDVARRQQQLKSVSHHVKSFRKEHKALHLIVVAGGDRNFVVKENQHISSCCTDWWSGDALMESWWSFLEVMGNAHDTELGQNSCFRYRFF